MSADAAVPDTASVAEPAGDPAGPPSEPRMLVDGRLVESGAGTYANVNPATEQVIGEVTDASVADVRRAIDAARRAFDETSWSTDRAFRQRCLLQLQEGLEREQEALREELILEVGCPRMVTYGPQLDAPLADALRYPAQLIDEYPWQVDLGDAMVSLTGQMTARAVWREPVGVVAAIVPWNYPFEVMLHKVGQALATGNTLVVKPAPQTPFNATRLGRIVAEQTDIPPGVVNVVTPSDNAVAEELVVSPKVDLVSFTGSTAVGRRIMATGAATLKRLFLELGGKSAAVVLDDADLEAASLIGLGVCMHAGQGCATPTRMLLPRSRYDEGVEHLVQLFRTVTVGDPQLPETLCGPVITAAQRDRILGYVRSGIADGATPVIGGDTLPEGPGWFVEPTLFVDVDNSMTIAREEIFGPVLTVIPYDGEDEAVRIANDNDYGLAGYVLSESDERAFAVARRLRAGSIGLNGTAAYGAEVPFGGYKASGIGRQNGIAGFEQYLEVKAVASPTR